MDEQLEAIQTIQPQRSPHRKKFIILGVFIILLICIAAVGLSVTYINHPYQGPYIQPENWTVEKDPQLHYSFAFPGVRQEDYIGIYRRWRSGSSGGEAAIPTHGIFIDMFIDNGMRLPADIPVDRAASITTTVQNLEKMYALSPKSTFADGCMSYQYSGTTNLDGIKATKLVGNAVIKNNPKCDYQLTDNNETIVILKNNDLIFRVTLIPYPNKSNDILTTDFTKILSSFNLHYLESVSPSSTQQEHIPTLSYATNWKSYSNNLYSISYPSDLNILTGSSQFQQINPNALSLTSKDFATTNSGYTSSGFLLTINVNPSPSSTFNFNSPNGIIFNKNVSWVYGQGKLVRVKYVNNDLFFIATKGSTIFQMDLNVASDDIATKNQDLLLQIANTIKFK